MEGGPRNDLASADARPAESGSKTGTGVVARVGMTLMVSSTRAVNVLMRIHVNASFSLVDSVGRGRSTAGTVFWALAKKSWKQAVQKRAS